MAFDIQPFIHRKIVVLNEDTSAMQVARAMCENRIGCVIIADKQGHITGIVTDRDIACGLIAYGRDSSVAISEIMTADPIVVDERATIQEVVGLMESFGVRRVPVVQTRGAAGTHGSRENHEKCVGLVSLDDLIVSKSIGHDRLARVVRSQIMRRGMDRIRGVREERREARSEAHLEQSYNHFFHVVAGKTALDARRAEEVGKLILEKVVQRLHYTGAARLVAQLPARLRDVLLDLPAGPDRSISLRSVIREISETHGIAESTAHEILCKFGDALASVLDPRELEHAAAQLPDDLREALGCAETTARPSSKTKVGSKAAA